MFSRRQTLIIHERARIGNPCAAAPKRPSGVPASPNTTRFVQCEFGAIRPESKPAIFESVTCDKGQLSPIRVRWSAGAGKWIIVAGERRWRATQRAGRTTVDCYFHEQALSESQILEEQLIENCLREDLQPLEEAKAFEKLMELNGWNAKQLAEAIRVHPSKVSRVLCLLKLPPAIQEQVASGELSARSAYEISKLSDKAAQQRLAALARDGELTHRQIAGKVRQRRGKRKTGPRTMKRSFIAENGWKVVVSSKKRGSYHDMEQALCQALQEVRHYIDNGVQLY